MHPATLPPEELLRQCAETRTRRGGPGGQHRNKVETAVVLLHSPTGISAEAAERRSQEENRRMALKRLRLRLARQWLPQTATGPHEPSPLWLTRAKGGRLAVALEHDDYPALVAEALQALEASAFDVAAAAASLHVSTSQLLKLFRRVPAAWVQLNRLRLARGLPPLR